MLYRANNVRTIRRKENQKGFENEKESLWKA